MLILFTQWKLLYTYMLWQESDLIGQPTRQKQREKRNKEREQREMEGENEKGRVCVTGGTGFIASWLIMKLLQHGYSVNATIRSHPGMQFSPLSTLPFYGFSWLIIRSF